MFFEAKKKKNVNERPKIPHSFTLPCNMKLQKYFLFKISFRIVWLLRMFHGINFELPS